MTVLTRRTLRHSPLDRRGLAVFLICQALILAGALFFTEWLPVLLFGALCVMLFVLASLSRAVAHRAPRGADHRPRHDGAGSLASQGR